MGMYVIAYPLSARGRSRGGITSEDIVAGRRARGPDSRPLGRTSADGKAVLAYGSGYGYSIYTTGYCG